MLKNLLIILFYFAAAAAVEIFVFITEPIMRGIKTGVYVIGGIIVYYLIKDKLSRKVFWIMLVVGLMIVCATPVGLIHRERNAEFMNVLEQDIVEYGKDKSEEGWVALLQKWELEKDAFKEGNLDALREYVAGQKTMVDNTQIKLGTDLNGGYEILYEVLPVKGQTDANIDEGTLDIIRDRINNSGLAGNTVQSIGKNRILVQVPGYNHDEVEKVKKIIQTRGHLAFRLVSNNNAMRDRFEEIRNANLAIRAANSKKPKEEWDPLQTYPDDYELMPVPDDWKKDNPAELDFLLVETEDENTVTGDHLSSVYPTQDQNGMPAVSLEFTLMGRRKIARVSERHLKERLAIVLDGKLKSAPVLQAVITRSAQITGNFTDEDVKEMIDVLRAGSLDIRMKELSEYSVEASLGSSSIENGVRSILYAAGAVLVFMLIYYLKAGAIADATLMFNLILILGAMSLFQVTLTLPGIAGLLLTIGMSVDANIIIFERIREEIKKRREKSDTMELEDLKLAVEKGYRSAFWTIFDANITTLITALILLLVGTITIKGFAITLSIGILASMFSALVLSRTLFQVLLNLRVFSNTVRMLEALTRPSFRFVAGKVKAPKGRMQDADQPETSEQPFVLKWGFQMLSIALIIAGLVLFFAAGNSKYGVDFNGGSITKVAFKPGIEAEALRTDLEDEFPNIKVQRFYDPTKKGSNTYSIYLPDKEAVRHARDLFKAAFGTEPSLVKEFDYDEGKQKDYVKPEKVWFAYDGATGPDTTELDSPKAKNLFFRGFDVAYLMTAKGELPGAKGISEQLPKKEFRRLAVHAEGGQATIIVALRTEREKLKSALIEKYDEKLLPDGFPEIEQPDDKVPDFEVQVNLSTEEELTADQIKARLSAEEVNALNFSAVSVTLDSPNTVRLSLTADSDTAGKPDVKEAVKARLPVSQRFLGDNSIGSVVASELRERGIMAIILSLIAIVVYITVRFEFNFSVGAVAALVHDVLITIGVIVLVDSLGLVDVKIDLTILAAMLTIIGYSLNDTIVVFDRIREKFPLKDDRHQKSQTLPRSRIAGLIDQGINETLSRTILTSLTTLLVTLCLLFFGGGVIQGFAFALTVGVVVGTYSSIFVASPMVLLAHWLREKKKS